MIPWFQFTTIYLGPIPFQVWGFFVALGMILSIIIIWKRANKLNLDKEQVLDQATWMIVLGIIFSRIFHVVFYEPISYIENPINVFKIWNGGLSSFGGMFGAVLGFLLYIKLKSINKKKINKIINLMSFASVYGWIVGRLGCFMIHDHIGEKSDIWFAIQTPNGARLEMAMLEIMGLIPLAIIFFIWKNKKSKYKLFFPVLCMYYGILRFILDFFRATDISHADVRYLGLTPGQYFAILIFVVGGVLLKKSKNSK